MSNSDGGAAINRTGLPLAGGLLALLLLLGGVLVILISARNDELQTVHETQVQARILAANVTAALDFGDRATALQTVRALALDPRTQAAAVYDHAGQLFAGYSRHHPLPASNMLRQPLSAGNSARAIVPVVRDGQTLGTAYIEVVREPVSRRAARYGLIGILIIIAAVVVLALGWSQAALRSANRQLQSRAALLAEANSQLQVEMQERSKAEEQLRQAQKMQALGQLTGGIAHDFNNMLTIIQGSADMLRRPALDDGKRLRFADAIVQTSSRAAALTSQLLAFARRQPLKPQSIDLNARIRAMAHLLDRTLGEGVRIDIDLDPDVPPIQADPAQLEAAILNVAVNARDAMDGVGTLTIATSSSALPDGREAACVTVSDTGSGISPELLERIFEPFFTTKDKGKGTGLGLSQVYGFAKQSGGDLRVSSALGQGSSFSILLPAGTASGPGEDELKVPIGSGRRHGRILVVDDNEEVGRTVESMLRELGHEVTRASSGLEALKLAAAGEFDGIVTDVMMPGMGGLELLERIQSVLPGVPALLTTGYAEEIGNSGTLPYKVLLKPYTIDDLAVAVDQLLGSVRAA